MNEQQRKEKRTSSSSSSGRRKRVHSETETPIAAVLVTNGENHNVDSERKDKKKKKSKPTTTTTTTESLYSEDVVFAFFSKSMDALPGKGKQEKLDNGRSTEEFQELRQYKDWRKCLSNFYEREFELDGLRWNSVEHYYHACKFKTTHPDFYRLFSLDGSSSSSGSSSSFSRDPVLAKAAGGKTGIWCKGNKEKQRILRPKGVNADPLFFRGTTTKDDAMERAQYAKFSQHEDLRLLLLATKDAKLTHIIRGGNVLFSTLMNVRRRLLSSL